jgi:hypothetical protein
MRAGGPWNRPRQLLAERKETMAPVPQADTLPAATDRCEPAAAPGTPSPIAAAAPADQVLTKGADEDDLEAYSQTLLKIFFDW